MQEVTRCRWLPRPEGHSECFTCVFVFSALHTLRQNTRGKGCGPLKKSTLVFHWNSLRRCAALCAWVLCLSSFAHLRLRAITVPLEMGKMGLLHGTLVSEWVCMWRWGAMVKKRASPRNVGHTATEVASPEDFVSLNTHKPYKIAMLKEKVFLFVFLFYLEVWKTLLSPLRRLKKYTKVKRIKERSDFKTKMEKQNYKHNNKKYFKKFSTYVWQRINSLTWKEFFQISYEVHEYPEGMGWPSADKPQWKCAWMSQSDASVDSRHLKSVTWETRWEITGRHSISTSLAKINLYISYCWGKSYWTKCAKVLLLWEASSSLSRLRYVYLIWPHVHQNILSG